MLARLAGTFPGGLDINRYRETASDVVARLPPPLAPDMPIEQRELQLVFRHDCM